MAVIVPPQLYVELVTKEGMAVGYFDFHALYLDADTAAYSKTAMGPRMVTVQEVRATKDGIIDESGSAN